MLRIFEVDSFDIVTANYSLAGRNQVFTVYNHLGGTNDDFTTLDIVEALRVFEDSIPCDCEVEIILHDRYCNN